MNGAGMAPSSPVPRSALIACADLVKERGALLSHALSRVEVHSSRPGLPVPPAGLAGLRLNPLVETPLRLVFVPWLDQFDQRQQLPLRQAHPPRRYTGRHIEAGDKRPDAPVVILAGPVKSLVPPPPVGIVAQDIRKQTWRQIHGQLSAVPHGVALGLNPCHQVSCPMR